LSGKNRLREIRAGFEPAFWIANVTELFERLSYYAQSAVLAIFLHESLRLTAQQTGALMGIFGFAVWFLPVLGGSLADRFGFRNSLLFAYLILTLGYFLMGSLASAWMAPLRDRLPLYWLVLAVLMVPALGPSLVKPTVAGTTARASTENVRSLGYSIYYTLVNIGGALGPFVAFLVRKKMGWGIENVFRVAALSVFLMFWVTLFLYREPGKPDDARVESVSSALKNMFIVLGNFRYVTFLLISSGFYIVYWQIFLSMPIFTRRYVNPNADVDRLLSIEGLTVICFQILVAYLTRRIPSVQTIAIGFLLSAFSWVLLAVHPTVFMVGVMLVVLALGELTQASRYYEYCSRLAPPDQQGLYMGYAFLPIAIGYAIAGPLGGFLLREFGDVRHRPAEMWWVIVAIGLVTAALMWIYDKVVHPAASEATG